MINENAYKPSAVNKIKDHVVTRGECLFKVNQKKTKGMTLMA